MGLDQILRCCILDHECEGILWECHVGISGGHVGGKATAWKVLQVGLWWRTLFKDAKEYAKTCDVCQRFGRPLQRDEIPLNLVQALAAFKKWVVDFIGPINPLGRHSHVRYIITENTISSIRWKLLQLKYVLWIWLLDLSLRTSLLGLAALATWRVIRVITLLMK